MRPATLQVFSFLEEHGIKGQAWDQTTNGAIFSKEGSNAAGFLGGRVRWGEAQHWRMPMPLERLANH